MSVTSTGAFATGVTTTGSFRPGGVVTPSRRVPAWLASLLCGLATLLAAAPVAAVVSGTEWVVAAGTVIGAVTAVGIVAGLVPGIRRVPGFVVGIVQAATVLVVVSALYGGSPLPSPAVFAQFQNLVTAALHVISIGTAPVPPTPDILFLVACGLGVVAVAVHTTAVGHRAPAAAGVPLLAAFAVPAALADDLLPWWTLVAAAVGFGLLLLAPDGNRRQLPGGLTMVALATVLALLVGVATGFVGTGGRFAADTGPGEDGASIGLSPFTSLRGQLERTTPIELFEVRGMDQPTYLRALTLADYGGSAGWQATRPAPGAPLDATVAQPAPGVPGEIVDVTVTNVGFRDYWLPLAGQPLTISGLPENQYSYDADSGTAYAVRAQQAREWTENAFLPAPAPAQLRTAEGEPPAPIYANVLGIDQRVMDLTREITANATNEFDRVMAVQQFFTGPDTQFTYSLATAPAGGDDPLVEFLTTGRTGYCEQFASAMGAMLRTIGIPARVAVGFTAGRVEGDARRITTADAHAWVEAWFPTIGWTVFDPTPLADGRTIVPPYVEAALAEAAGGTPAPGAAIPVPPPAPAPTDVPTPAPDAGGEIPDETGPADGGGVDETGGVSPLWALAALPVVLLVLLFLPMLRRSAVRRARLSEASAGGPGAVSAAWDELLAASVDHGAPVHPTDTVRAAGRRLVREHQLDHDVQDSLRALVSTVEASWYGGDHPAPKDLDAPVAAVLAGIRAGGGLTARGRLLPRSLVGATAIPSPAAKRKAAAKQAAAEQAGATEQTDGPPAAEQREPAEAGRR